MTDIATVRSKIATSDSSWQTCKYLLFVMLEDMYNEDTVQYCLSVLKPIIYEAKKDTEVYEELVKARDRFFLAARS